MLGDHQHESHIDILSNFLARNRKPYPMLAYEWLGSILFNVAAMNEEYL